MAITAVHDVRNGLKGSLSREDILTTALRIARRSDLSGLNMRELARELGVTPMAIYHHFESKSALIEGIIDRHFTESGLTVHAVDKADWRAWLKETFIKLHNSFVNAPGVQPMVASINHFGPALLRFIDDTLEVLMKAGLSKMEAARVFSTLTSLVMGHAVLQSLKVPNAAYFDRVIGERRAGRADALFAEYPYFGAMTDVLAARSGVVCIDYELDLMLDSVGRQIALANASRTS